MIGTARRLRAALRPSFVGLLALLALSAFCLLHQHLNDRGAPRPFSFFHPIPPARSSNSHFPPPGRDWRRLLVSKPQRAKLVLTPQQELAAVIAFMAALPSNALPDSADPLRPIDPDLVIDFDTRAPEAEREVQRLVEDTWARLPVVLLAKHYSPASREIKHFLSEYNLIPLPTIFHINERVDEKISTSLLYRLTNATDFPVLLISGRTVGPLARIRELHSTGELDTMITSSGAIVNKGKKKKGRHVARM